MDRHLSAFPTFQGISKALISHLAQRKSPPHEKSMLAVLQETLNPALPRLQISFEIHGIHFV